MKCKSANHSELEEAQGRWETLARTDNAKQTSKRNAAQRSAAKRGKAFANGLVWTVAESAAMRTARQREQTSARSTRARNKSAVDRGCGFGCCCCCCWSRRSCRSWCEARACKVEGDEDDEDAEDAEVEHRTRAAENDGSHWIVSALLRPLPLPAPPRLLLRRGQLISFPTLAAEALILMLLRMTGVAFVEHGTLTLPPRSVWPPAPAFAKRGKNTAGCLCCSGSF